MQVYNEERGKMNKRGHHELGYAPYAFIGAAIGVVIAYFRKMFSSSVGVEKRLKEIEKHKGPIGKI